MADSSDFRLEYNPLEDIVGITALLFAITSVVVLITSLVASILDKKLIGIELLLSTQAFAVATVCNISDRGHSEAFP